MFSYCLKWRKNTEGKIKNLPGEKTRIMLWSKCAISDSKNSKQQDDSGLLSSLGRKTSLSKIPTVGSLLF